MARTNEFTECLVDWVDGRLRQNRFSNLWLGGGAGAHGGSSYRPIDGQLTQRHVCYDTSEAVSPCSPSGFSSLVDNLRRIRYWQEPATWFGAETTSGLQIYIKPGLWYPSTMEYCAFAGGNSPTFTLPGALDRIDTVYIDPSGILHIQRGTPAVSPTITLPPIASGIPLWAVYLPPTASGVYFQVCSGYYAGQAYIERDLRPFLNLGGTAASGVLPGYLRGAILRGADVGWETYPIGVINTILTNDGTDVMWSAGAINLTAGKTLTVNANITLDGVDGKSLVLINGLTVEGGNEGILHFDAAASITIEANSILNQDLTTDASVTFADVFVPDGGTFGISGNELLTVNAAGNFTFSGITSIVVPDGTWIGIGAAAERIIFDSAGDISIMGAKFAVGTLAPDFPLELAEAAATTLAVRTYSTADSHTAKLFLMKSHHATLGTLAETTDGDYLGDMRFYGVSTVPAIALGAQLYAIQRGAAGGTYVETDLVYRTCSATGINSNQLFLDGGTGYIGIGTSAPDGTLHVWTASAGAVTASASGDDLTVENSGDGGISILVPDASDANIYFGSPSDNISALIRWEYNELRMMVGTATTNGVLSLRSGNAVEAIKIEADGDTFFNGGDVGIGVSPNYRLDVKDDVAGGFAAHFFNDGDNINRYGIHVQAGADNGAAVGSTFYFYATDGDGNSTGNLLTINGVFQLQDVSDRDRKTKIKNTEIVGLDIINGLQVRDYNWKANPKGPVMTSFVAQEVQEIFPAMVAEAPDGTLMTARAMLIPVLTKAIQELDARLTRLEVK